METYIHIVSIIHGNRNIYQVYFMKDFISTGNAVTVKKIISFLLTVAVFWCFVKYTEHFVPWRSSSYIMYT